jgi:CRISPR-associated protein Cas2
MRLLVIYDIPDDGKRTRVADVCLDFGLDRMQFSVFTGELSGAHRKELTAKLKKTLGRTEGKILFLPVCLTDWETRMDIVNAKPGASAAAPAAGEDADVGQPI